MFIKICANTNLADAQLAVELGADAVGFVFAPSKRQMTLEQAESIARLLPAGVEKVGVFATDDPYEVEHSMAASALTVAQLHNEFDQGMVQALSGEFGGKLKIIQAVSYEVNATERAAADARFEAALRAVLAEPAIWAVLLDAAKGGVSGGLGTTFDWAHAAPIVRRVYASAQDGKRELPKLILAGGLHAENVGTAIAEFAPWGVDVASGVEAAPGRKDPAKLKAFIAAARDAVR
ncbi:phosphoribosylanthranilate isomerase [Granulicella mallensis]|uniref:N-(5'-phosphoribosyl)anthranilate isomerase n=1 Tax=Granulicella mallensis (strain ATCC BAA-1857 / DSM 23137 / MP5ACTX8) TaxID=682795 RepID=G8NUW9_GRAMM|nr:phosphoribosylanthranilate isomerase [Granulicella mallensis]AEU38739.1 N-(5'phosphoribosyl)anthranilate isomerase (PRAI) [Granulicella mallensis MP5ACTX8]